MTRREGKKDMTFADLRMGDYFSLDGKPYIRLQEYIMSLDKDFFGIVYTTPVGSYQVEFLSSFEYKSNLCIVVDLNIDPNNVPIDKAPCNMLLQNVNTNALYVKIKDLYGIGFKVVCVKALENQGKFFNIEKNHMNVHVVDKMTVVYNEENI